MFQEIRTKNSNKTYLLVTCFHNFKKLSKQSSIFQKTANKKNIKINVSLLNYDPRKLNPWCCNEHVLNILPSHIVNRTAHELKHFFKDQSVRAAADS